MVDTGLPQTTITVSELIAEMIEKKAARMGRDVWRVTVYQNGSAQFYTSWSLEHTAADHADMLRQMYARNNARGIFVKKEMLEHVSA